MKDFRNNMDHSSKIEDELAEARAQFNTASATLKTAIHNQVGSLSAEAKRLLTIAAVSVGLTIAAGLFITFTRRGKNGVPKSQSQGSQALYVEPWHEHPIITSIKTSITSFLLSIARDKIVDFIEKMNEKHEQKIAASGTGKSED